MGCRTNAREKDKIRAERQWRRIGAQTFMLRHCLLCGFGRPTETCLPRLDGEKNVGILWHEGQMKGTRSLLDVSFRNLREN